MPNGQVKNHSNRELWVVETDSGTAIAHRLLPGRQSPSSVDADGFRAVDGTLVDGHDSWVKIVNFSTADVANNGDELRRGCYLCLSVADNEFGNVTYDRSSNWGGPISGFLADGSTRKEYDMSRSSLVAKINELSKEAASLPSSETRSRLENVITKLNGLAIKELNEDGTPKDERVPESGMSPNPIILGDGYMFCC